ncbi:MAG: DUF1016 family protein [Oligoflexia bacterium]|nr:DUF1016 family protein [Oligoflexia bacterium]
MANIIASKTINAQSKNYSKLLGVLKTQISKAKIKAAVAVNKGLILLYWQIGNHILKSQISEGWGAGVIDRLSKDLRSEFPEMNGFSSRNLKYMRKFAQNYSDYKFVQEVLAQLTWYHNITLLEKIKSTDERSWYIKKSIENGWSRSVLVHQIESKLYRRQGKAVNNFSKRLPKPQSDLANNILKDPYNFDFLSLSEKALERDLEQGLIDHIQKFLIELGVGFAFVGRQFHLDIGDEDFYIDLLFYHLKLRCFIVIDLKMVDFKPEFAGKMNFYLSIVDEKLKHHTDQPSIGLILCKKNNKIIAEYALRDIKKPMGIASYEIKLIESLPKKLQGQLPTIEEIEKEMGNIKKKL